MVVTTFDSTSPAAAAYHYHLGFRPQPAAREDCEDSGPDERKYAPRSSAEQEISDSMVRRRVWDASVFVAQALLPPESRLAGNVGVTRSEERRVGKEGRCR